MSAKMKKRKTITIVMLSLILAISTILFIQSQSVQGAELGISITEECTDEI